MSALTPIEEHPMDEQPEATKQQQLDALRAWVADTSIPLRIVGEPWSDDHILCCTVSVRVDVGAGPETEVDLWWVGWEGVAAATYCHESAQACADLASALASTIEGLEDEVACGDDEFSDEDDIQQ